MCAHTILKSGVYFTLKAHLNSERAAFQCSAAIRSSPAPPPREAATHEGFSARTSVRPLGCSPRACGCSPYLRVSAFVQQFNTVEKQRSDSSVVFLILVLLHHHVAGNPTKHLYQLDAHSPFSARFKCRPPPFLH